VSRFRTSNTAVELLEGRTLFVGTEGNDVIHVGVLAGDPSTYTITVNGVVVEQRRGGEYLTIECLGGDDTFTVDPLFAGELNVIGGEGNDLLFAGQGRASLLGNAGNDTLIGGKSTDLIIGGAGNDLLRGGRGHDQMFGDGNRNFDGTTRSGNDIMYGDDGYDRLYGGGGFDRIRGGVGDDFLYGNDGNDQLYGEAGNDQLWFPRDFIDELTGGGGDDYFDGGDGDDTLNVVSVPGSAPMIITFDDLANDGLAGDAANVTATFEHVIASDLGGDSVIDASLLPFGIDIGVESAPLDPDPLAAPITFIGTPFDDRIGNLRPSSQESHPLQISGLAGNDALEGNWRSDWLDGGDGDDTIFGRDGNDAIVGGDGNDLIEGGGGSDRIAAGVGNDVAYGDDTLIETYGSDTIEGNAGNDVLIGGGNNDVILGEGGHDTIIGGGGNDRMFGGPDAADKILGGAGTDSAAQDDKDTYDSVETLLT